MFAPCIGIFACFYFRALYKCKNGKELARKTFNEHKDFYHPICGAMVAKDLGVPY
jgi:leukotriene-A4 hydrolase